MEVTLDLSGVEVRDVEVTEAEYPDAMEFRVEGVVTDLSDDTIGDLVGKRLDPKAVVLDVEESEAS